MVDMVNHPPHYTRGGVECIDALASATAGLEWLDAVCTANAIKYLWRWKQKNGVEDLRKAQWYINKLIETSVVPQPDLLRRGVPSPDQTWAKWVASEDRQDDYLGTC
jgi:hypothetical protein